MAYGIEEAAYTTLIGDLRGAASELGSTPDAPEHSVIWTPLTGPQTLAYYCDADELFYGGAGGGGKTDLLIGLAGTAHRRSVIFRREFPRLRAIIERSREVYNPPGINRDQNSYNESLHIWRLGYSRFVEFAAVHQEKQKENQRGRPRDFYGWDEVTEFSETTFRFVNAWNRTTYQGQRCRVVATGNPPSTVDGQWVIAYWGPWLDKRHPKPAAVGELRWFVRVKNADVEVSNGLPVTIDGEELIPRSRTFIPARLSDNPALAATGYGAVLQGLPEPLRSQMLYGDFSATQADDAWQVIPTQWIQDAMTRWREQPKPDVPLSAIGNDPSRGGDDKFCIAKRYANWVAPVIKHSAKEAPDGPSGARLIVQALQGEARPLSINIDIIGIAGASVYDHTKGLKLPAVALNGSEASRAKDKSGRLPFVNKRAEWHWRLREALDPTSGQDVALPDDPELLADLCAPRWEPTPRGIKIEDKDDIKARLGRSPDVGEAVIYAFADDGEGMLGWARQRTKELRGLAGDDGSQSARIDNTKRCGACGYTESTEEHGQRVCGKCGRLWR